MFAIEPPPAVDRNVPQTFVVTSHRFVLGREVMALTRSKWTGNNIASRVELGSLRSKQGLRGVCWLGRRRGVQALFLPPPNPAPWEAGWTPFVKLYFGRGLGGPLPPRSCSWRVPLPVLGRLREGGSSDVLVLVASFRAACSPHAFIKERSHENCTFAVAVCRVIQMHSCFSISLGARLFKSFLESVVLKQPCAVQPALCAYVKGVV